MEEHSRQNKIPGEGTFTAWAISSNDAATAVITTGNIRDYACEGERGRSQLVWLSVTTLMLGNTNSQRCATGIPLLCATLGTPFCCQEWRLKHALFLRVSLSSNILLLLATLYSLERVSRTS